jgi:hypothetical protein
MQLKMLVLSASALALWLTPLTALDKKVSWHKAIQGVSLFAGISCAVTAGNIARKLVPELEIELIKERAIKADIIDEIGTSAYVSQQQRQKEAEGILVSPPGVDIEEGRKALEAVYSEDFQSEPTATATDDTSDKDASDLKLWWKVEAAQIEGKPATWIIENLLGQKGRKFNEGKTQLAKLLKKFGNE